MEQPRQHWLNEQLYLGLDLHKHKWVVTVRTQDVHLKTFVSTADKEILLKSLTNNWPGAKMRAVYEAGCFGYHLAEFLNGHGIETIIVAPHTIPIEPGRFVKTDTIDSKKLALELAKGSLRGIYQRSPDELYDRSLIRKRQQLVKRRVQIQLQVKSDLTFYGIALSFPLARYWSKQVLARLRTLTIGTTDFQKVLQLSLQEYEALCDQIRTVDKLLLELSQSEKYQRQMSILQRVPGIGRLAGLTLLLELGNIRRFRNAEQFDSYLGLTPSEHSSGDSVKKGSLTGMGHTRLRTLLIEAAWTAIRQDPVLLQKFQRLSVGKSKCKAIVAVAKSLANRIRRVLLNQEPYVIGVG
jgi:transposase